MRTLAMVAALGLAVGTIGVQNLSAQETQIGVKAGFVSANVDEDGADSRSSFAFGAFAQLPVAPNLSVQPELLYTGKGFAGEADGVDSEFQLSYLEIPVLVQYHFPVEGSVAPRLFAGPTVAFELGCDVEGTDGSVSASFSCDEFADFGLDLTTKSTDFGLAFGAGVGIESGAVTVTVDGRYVLGLTDIFEFEGVSALKNRAWELFLGAGFPVGP